MTPGPWIVEKHSTKYPDLFEHSIISPSPANGEEHTYGIVSGIDDEQDANLLAAAPELLEACKLLTAAVIRLERLHKECIGLDLAKSRKRASTAIAKAEGRKP